MAEGADPDADKDRHKDEYIRRWLKGVEMASYPRVRVRSIWSKLLCSNHLLHRLYEWGIYYQSFTASLVLININTLWCSRFFILLKLKIVVCNCVVDLYRLPVDVSSSEHFC